VPHHAVFRFILVLVEKLVPEEIWGSRENFKTISKAIKFYIYLRRYESMNLNIPMHDFNVNPPLILANIEDKRL
jgi:hypothetical protein